MKPYTISLEEAKKRLDEDQIIAIPTETVYGLAGNAYKSSVVKKIFEIKQRPFYNPLIVHTESIEAALTFTKNWTEKAFILAKRFWPGALTLLLEKQDRIPNIVTANTYKVATRVPSHPLTLDLLKRIDFPLAAPSANLFQYISPTSARHVVNQLGKEQIQILDGGDCELGLESTIVGFENNQIIIYRLGAIPVEEIEKIVGKVIVNNMYRAQFQLECINMPGGLGLDKHYAPRKKIIVGNIRKLIKEHAEKKIGILSFQENYAVTKLHEQCILSRKGNLQEAGKNFFSMLRILDQSDVTIIITDYLPNEGLGVTMNERISKAIL